VKEARSRLIIVYFFFLFYFLSSDTTPMFSLSANYIEDVAAGSHTVSISFALWPPRFRP
jgi:hypothetical protein